MNSKIDLSLRNLYSLILTTVAWIIPIVVLSILNKEVTGSDSFVAYRTGNLFDYLMISAIILGSLNWMLNRITDLPNIRKLSMGLIIGIRSLSFLLILILYDLSDQSDFGGKYLSQFIVGKIPEAQSRKTHFHVY